MTDTLHGFEAQGALVDLVALAGSESDWWTLAYETELRGRGRTLAREHFEQAVANFKRIGRDVPVVLYHADTDSSAHPDSRKAHAWLTALRVGSMTLDGRIVATLEGRRRWVNDATRNDVASGALVCGSITVLFDSIDDVSGESVGTVLRSFSLTNNPALTRLPQLAASQGATDSPPGAIVATAERGNAAPEMDRMSNKYLTLAAQLGVAAASEEDAEKAVNALAREAVDTRRALNLGAAATPTEFAARVAALSTAAAALPSVRAELEALKAVETARATVERKAHVDALILAQPALEPARVALEAFAAQDYAAFAAKYPRPAVDPRVTALTSRVTPSGGRTPSVVSQINTRRHNDQADERAHELMAKDSTLAYDAALTLASRELHAGQGA